ncbi:MAG: hypothetical protein IH861_08480 [Chloroflexi bacterium]|nr:hypothetical protein [Chloroflexota bacterium]
MGKWIWLYIKEDLKKTFRPADRIDFVFALVLAVIAALLAIASTLGLVNISAKIAELNLGYRTGVGLGILVFVLLFVLNPVRMWIEKAKTLEKLTTRSLGLETSVVFGQQDQTAVVKVKNLASDGSQVVSCTGFLHGVYHVTDGQVQKETKISGVYLRWSARHGGTVARELTFSSEAELDVAVLESSALGSPLIVAFDHKLRGQYRLYEQKEWIFDIEITALERPKIRGSFRLITDPLGMRAKPDGFGGYILGPLPNWTFEETDIRL